jgi:Phosphate-selective porin O and P
MPFASTRRRSSTTIFFESNGGQAKAEATLPEIRLAVAEPDLDVGNVETALEGLSTTCYYLSAEKNRYRFSLSPNLNKVLADRRDNPSDFSDATQLRRTRVAVYGTVYQDWEYKVEADFAGTTTGGSFNDVTITDAYLRYTGFKPFSFTAGNFKVPFSLEAVSSAMYITFMERGLVGAAVAPAAAVAPVGARDPLLSRPSRRWAT